MSASPQTGSEQDKASGPCRGYRLRIRGQVQGVGFRPFVYQLAQRLQLRGDVRNDSAGVLVRLWGSEHQIDTFERLLLEQLPPMALVDELDRQPLESMLEATEGFTISASDAGEVEVGVTPDASVCPECLNELFNPSDRRYRYPFINCTHCGPRYSLIKQLPYDRPHTTMADFKLCPDCMQEYQDPADRRFHAQPNACPECGPQLRLLSADGKALECFDPIAETLRLIDHGEIVAIKGIGGFHLVCDARNADAVAELRRRKHRDQKPFAVMAANIASLTPWVSLNRSRIEQLQSRQAPIVLCPALEPEAMAAIAPALNWLGVMLPHSPLHYLLFHQAAGRPAGSQWLQLPQSLLLVMTSANPSGEPLVTDNDEAVARLGGLADAILLHDRDIHIRCDDSVVHGGSDRLPPALIRRGRGLAPQLIRLDPRFKNAPSVLATGALLKNTICLTKGDRAYVSQHIGDLDNPSCCRALEQTVEHLCRLFEIEPALVVHDLHPDNFASQFAQRYAGQRQLPALAVQHHQAHVAAVIAEHQAAATLSGPVLGLALDGFGLGDDGHLWGGELLRLEGIDYLRLGHLQPLPLPGADKAAREPWRMAAAVLHRLGEGEQIVERFAEQPASAMLLQMLDKQLNCPLTSSVGRLFDAVAGILEIQPVAGYEAQPAMILEGLAQRYLEQHDWPVQPCLIEVTDNGGLDPLPLLKQLVEWQWQDSVPSRKAPDYCAALFHRQLADALAAWVQYHNRHQSLQTIVVAGGCFLNQLLSTELIELLQQQRLQVLRAEQLPCNDGGLSLGQAWLGLQQLSDCADNKIGSI